MGTYNHYAAGLPDPKDALTDLGFEQQTIIYDNTGKRELARLGALKREVVTFDQIPGEMIDATTAIEDKDFWENAGFDPVGIVSAGLDTIAGRPRGASTITQQLVRARLLPPEAFEGTTYERKLREIIQSIRLTEAYPGEAGKKEIITAYLNQNFYGNSSYGVKAAAKGYFGKPLADLTLAQFAILAAIPQSPTKFDLMKNAEEICLESRRRGRGVLEDPARRAGDDRGRRPPRLHPRPHEDPQHADRREAHGRRVRRRQGRGRRADPAAIDQLEGAALRVAGPRGPRRDRSARPRRATARRSTPAATASRRRSTGRCSRRSRSGSTPPPARRTPRTRVPSCARKKIPSGEWSWILGLRGHNINNAAAGVIDYRTGDVLAYAGSASYTSKGNKKFQPQFDVLSDGFRQPGSAIKPIDYLIGIDDQTLTASTMFMDVFTNFGNNFTPVQADKAERGPVRLRSALQFSLNVPAIKATMITGLDHTFERTKDFGLRYPATEAPVKSMGIGTLVVHPIDLLGAYGTAANGGVLMPRTMITTVVDADGKAIYPLKADPPAGKRVVSKQAAYIVTDILAGNTDVKVNPFWGKHAIYDGKTRRPAAYKTGTTNDNKDVAAYGYLAPPADPDEPALAVGIWMGNSDSTPNDGKLSLDTSAPLWSAILTDISRGTPIAKFKAAERPRRRPTVDAFTGLKPGPFTTKTVKELFIKGTVPTQKETSRVSLQIDAASGLLWQDGCVGPQVTKGFMNLNEVEAGLPRLAEGGPQLGGPGRQGRRRPRRLQGHAHGLLLRRRVLPVRAHLGRPVRARRNPVRWPPRRRRRAIRCSCRPRRRRARRSSRSPAAATRTR